jgi:hypothetical protein
VRKAEADLAVVRRIRNAKPPPGMRFAIGTTYQPSDPKERQTMIKTVHGIVHGRTIELHEELGVPEGEEVEVQVRVTPKTSRKPGEGFLRTEGALADDTEWDAIMEEIYQARKSERRPQTPDLGEL